MGKSPDYEVWYCKANKKTGDPIIIKDLERNKIESTDTFVMRNVDVVMQFNNASSEAKRSGATTVLKVYKRS